MSSTSLIEPEIVASPTSRQRWLDLMTVFLLDFGVSIYLAFAELLGHHIAELNTASARQILATTRGLVSLLIMYLLLRRQGRKMSEIVGDFNWTDLLLGAALMLFMKLAIFVMWLGIDFTYWMIYHSHAPVWNKAAAAFGNQIGWGTFFFLVGAPLSEEIIARAYVITEVAALTKSTNLALFICFVLQVSYHVYQGWINAVLLPAGMLCLSLFYVKTRRAVPNIFAHFYMNAWSRLF